MPIQLTQNSITPEQQKGLITGALLSAAINAFTGNTPREAFINAAAGASKAYSGGVDSIYRQKANELEMERQKQLMDASNWDLANQKTRFEWNKEDRNQELLDAATKRTRDTELYNRATKEYEQRQELVPLDKQAREANIAYTKAQTKKALASPLSKRSTPLTWEQKLEKASKMFPEVKDASEDERIERFKFITEVAKRMHDPKLLDEYINSFKDNSENTAATNATKKHWWQNFSLFSNPTDPMGLNKESKGTKVLLSDEEKKALKPEYRNKNVYRLPNGQYEIE